MEIPKPKKPIAHDAAEEMERTVNSLRALGITEFEGEVCGWGRVSFTLGHVPEWWPRPVLDFLQEADDHGTPPGVALAMLRDWLEEQTP